MTKIEHRIEAPRLSQPDYANKRFTADDVAAGKHRNFVGGKWETLGKIQLDFLIQRGLRADSRLLDVGCGSLRAGVQLVTYLNPGNYYGIDINPGIIESGYDHELSDDQRQRLPVENLRATDRFDADFGVLFDMAIAQSVFTHVSLNHIRLCLYRIAKVMKPGGVFYATFNPQPRSFPLDGVKRRRHTERNGFWYYRRDLKWAASFSPWTFEYIGEWGHPRHQKMIKFTRTSDQSHNKAKVS